MEGIPEVKFLWERPNEIPWPNIWHRFETKPKNGTVYNVRIEDLTDDRFEEALQFMMMYYFPDEPLSVSTNLMKDETSMMIYQYLLHKIFQQRMSVLAVLDNDTPKPKIVGLQIFSVASISDTPLPEVPGEAISKFRKIYMDIRKNSDPFKILKTDKYFQDWGLCVSPEFRGLNIGFTILINLQILAKTFKIPGTLIMFTRIQSQILAKRAGFQLYNEIVYEDYKDENGQVIFPIEGTKSLKYMGQKYI